MSNNDQTDNIYAGLPSDVVAKLKLAKESAKAAIDSQAKQAAEIARRNLEGMAKIAGLKEPLPSPEQAAHESVERINREINAEPLSPSSDETELINPLIQSGGDLTLNAPITIDKRLPGIVKHFQELRDSHDREASCHLEEATYKANSAQRESNLREYLNKRILVDALDYVLSVLKGETKT